LRFVHINYVEYIRYKNAYIVEDDLVLFDEFVAVLAVVEVNEHVCEVVFELRVFLHTHLLHLLSVHGRQLSRNLLLGHERLGVL